jgi:hypothetical protein
MLTSTCAHYPVANGTASFEVGALCMTKPMPESSCEMSIVAKAAGVRNFAEMLTCNERGPAGQRSEIPVSAATSAGPKSGSAQRSFMTLRMRANSLSA